MDVERGKRLVNKNEGRKKGERKDDREEMENEERKMIGKRSEKIEEKGELKKIGEDIVNIEMDEEMILKKKIDIEIESEKRKKGEMME